MHVRNKLNVKQLGSLTTPGIYSDGGGLYLRVRPTGTRSWLFICMLAGKRREMGLGSVLDVPLAKACEKAASARAVHLEGRDPIMAHKAIVRVEELPATKFGTFAMKWLDEVE